MVRCHRFSQHAQRDLLRRSPADVESNRNPDPRQLFGGDTFAETEQRLAAYRKQLEQYAR